MYFVFLQESMVLIINDEYKQQVAYGFLGRWKVGVEPLSQLCLIGTWKVVREKIGLGG